MTKRRSNSSDPNIFVKESYLKGLMKEAIAEYFSSQEDPEFFTKNQLANRWQVNERYIRNLITSGKLEATKLGSGPTSPFRIPRKAALDFESVHIFPKRN